MYKYKYKYKFVFVSLFVFVFVPLSDQRNGKNNLWEVSQLLKSPPNHCHLPPSGLLWINYSFMLILPTTTEHHSLDGDDDEYDGDDNDEDDGDGDDDEVLESI